MGGDGECFRKGKRTNDKNIIWLYPKEHFIAHKLLCEENPNNKSLLNAWMMMAFPKGKCKRDFEISPKEYESLRIAWSTCCKGNNNFLSNNGHPWNYGLTKETDIRLKEYAVFMNDEIVGKKKLIRSMSAGNKQKIGIIAAMINRPQLLILDEPFNFLDPSSQNMLKKMIINYNKETGATILISSHNLTHTIDISNRIVVMEHGKIVKDLDNTDIKAKIELEEYFNM